MKLPASPTASIPCALAAAAAAALCALAAPAAHADDGLSFNAGVVTDYRYRGISQTRLKPALQGGADFTSGGFYAGTWLSTIKWLKDAGTSKNVEIDVYAGYKGEFSKELSYDVGLLGYIYPGGKGTYTGPSPNTTEIYGALSFGPITAKYSHSLSNLFGFPTSKNSGYFDLSASFDIGGGWTLAPHIGRQTVKKNSMFSYTDYSLTLSKDIEGFTVSAALVGTDAGKVGGVPVYASPSGKNLGRSGLVLGIKKSF
jgi:uncharacterized protein (TIGR02001 family)